MVPGWAWFFDEETWDWYKASINRTPSLLAAQVVDPSTEVLIDFVKPFPGKGRLRVHYDVPLKSLRTKKKLVAPVRFFVSEEPTESRSDFERARYELTEILQAEGGKIVDEYYDGPEYGDGIDAYFVVEVPADLATKVKKSVARTLRVSNEGSDVSELKRRLMPPA